MFSKELITDQNFTDLGSSAQALFFHLGVIADDDGFVNNPKDAQSRAHASDDDLRILVSKKLVIFIRVGLVVITDWKLHNQIQKDRYHPTIYQEEKNLLEVVNGKYQFKPTLLDGAEPYNNSCIQIVSRDKVSKDKNSKDEISLLNEMNLNPPAGDNDNSFNPDKDLPF